MGMLYVILNADDFGKSLEQNEAIDEAYKRGFVRSIGLIVTEQYMQDAIVKARKGGYIKNLHLHFNLKKCHAFKSIYRELVAQYNFFIEVTNGEADYKHVDFHVWSNLSWPVCLALNFFSLRFHVKTVRYWTIVGKKKLKNKLFRILSWNPFVKSIPSCSFFYFITKRQSLSGRKKIEIFCHPQYKDGELIDVTSSFVKYESKSLSKLMQDMRKIKGVEFVSWEEVQ
jgi:predicted glycoside hydrolase/deacetylase ChbG (UPF0249 family)